VTPTRVPRVRRRGVVGVVCGGYHTAIWTNDGRMYSFGLNTHGQLGIGRDPVDAAAARRRSVAVPSTPPTQYVAPASVWASLLRGGALTVSEDDDDDDPDAADSPAPLGSAMKSSESMPHISLRSMVESANAATALMQRAARRASLDLGAHRHGSGALKSAFESDVAIRAAHMARPFVSTPTRVRTGALRQRRTPGVTRVSAGWRTTFVVVEDERAAESKSALALFTSSASAAVDVDSDDDDGDHCDDDDDNASQQAAASAGAETTVIPFVAARGPGTPVRVKPVADKAPESTGDDAEDEAAFRTALRDLHRDGADAGADDEQSSSVDDLNSQSFVHLSSSNGVQVNSRANRDTPAADATMPPPSFGDFEHFDTLQKLATAAVAARETDSPRLAPMMRGRAAATKPNAAPHPLAPQLEPQVWRDELTLTTHWTHEILPDWDRRYAMRATRTTWRRGVPPDARGVVWQRAVGNDLQITQAQYAEFVNEAARARSGTDSPDVAPSDDSSPAAAAASAPKRRASSSEQAARLIEVDLPRTMPQLGAFKSGALRAELQEVLEAYAQFNRRTEYAQGMSYVAAMLHLHLRSPFDTFVTLANLLDRDMFQALYSVSVRGIARHVKVFDALFQRMLPKLSRHFLQLSIGTDYYLLDWFMTVFARALPYGCSARIWDCVLLEGDQFMFQSAVGLLRLHQDLLLKAEFEQCLQILRTLPAATDEEKLMRAVFSVTLPKEFDSLFGMIRADYERKRETQTAAAMNAGGRQNLLDAVKDNYLSTGASFITPTRLSMRPVVRDLDDNDDGNDEDTDEEVVVRPPVARRLDLL
jgi:hypothetical protein